MLFKFKFIECSTIKTIWNTQYPSLFQLLKLNSSSFQSNCEPQFTSSSQRQAFSTFNFLQIKVHMQLYECNIECVHSSSSNTSNFVEVFQQQWPRLLNYRLCFYYLFTLETLQYNSLFCTESENEKEKKSIKNWTHFVHYTY